MKALKIATISILALILGVSIEVADASQLSCPQQFSCSGTTIDTCKDPTGNSLGPTWTSHSKIHKDFEYTFSRARIYTTVQLCEPASIYCAYYYSSYPAVVLQSKGKVCPVNLHGNWWQFTTFKYSLCPQKPNHKKICLFKAHNGVE